MPPIDETLENFVKPFKRCIIHIGTEKTGTSTLQRFFHINRAKLRDDGLLYTKSAGKESQYGFFAIASDNFWRSRTEADPLGIDNLVDLEQYRNLLSDELHSEFTANHQCNTLLISSEHLHSRLQTLQQIKRLKDFLQPYCEEFTVLVYFRRQDRLAVSFYSTKVKSGVTNPQIFTYRKDKKPQYYYDYLQIFNNWASIFGEDSCIVREYDKKKFYKNNLIEDFCQTIRITPENKTFPKEINQSLNRKGLEFLAQVNQILPMVQDGSLSPERISLGRYVAEHYSGQEAICTRDQALKFYHIYSEQNRLLNQRLTKLGHNTLFDEDFSEYPETLEQLGTPAQAVAEVAIEIWRQYGLSYTAQFIKKKTNSLAGAYKKPTGQKIPRSANTNADKSQDIERTNSYLDRLIDIWKKAIN